MATIRHGGYHEHHLKEMAVPGSCPPGGHVAEQMKASAASQMYKEDERLRSLHKWTAKDIIDICKAARSGFYYSGVGDIVCCQFCKTNLGEWKRGDDIEAIHQDKSPNCPLLQNTTSSNIKSDRSKYDVCGMYEMPRFGVSHPEFESLSRRLDSFADWPHSMKQTPSMLAEAGFYYKGVGDQTVCFSCDGGLRDWEDEDVPWEQHALWMPNCPYLLACKGEDFIQRFSAA